MYVTVKQNCIWSSDADSTSNATAAIVYLIGAETLSFGEVEYWEIVASFRRPYFWVSDHTWKNSFIGTSLIIGLNLRPNIMEGFSVNVQLHPETW